MAESIPFCEKNSNEALPPILGPDVPRAAVAFAVKITERDTKAKTAEWFKEKVPIIVNRDGKMAFERSRTNRHELTLNKSLYILEIQMICMIDSL